MWRAWDTQQLGTVTRLSSDFSIKAHLQVEVRRSSAGSTEDMNATTPRQPLNSSAATAISNAQAVELYVQGRQYKASNNFTAAEQAYREVLQLQPDYVDAWISLGILLRAAARLEEAEACQRTALEFDPESFAAQLNLGSVLRDRGDTKAAEASFRRALERNPASAEAHNNLGRVLMDQGEHTQAVPCFVRARQLNPQYFEALDGLGTSLFHGAFYQDAIPVLVEISRLRPADIYSLLLLGHAYLAEGKLPQAEAEYQSLLRMGSGMPKAKAGLAAVLASRGQYNKPRALFEEAVAAEPNDYWIHGHYSHFLLRSGEYQRAWRYYEHRWHAEQSKRVLIRHFAQPKWRGEPLADKTLLIVAEQGLGDEIMFASLFAELIGEARHCIIECDQRLGNLFKASFPMATIFPVARNVKHWQRVLEANLESLPEFDCWHAIGSLPQYRRTDATSFPQHRGYLIPNAQRVQHWQSRLQALGPGLKIGLSWRGGTKFTNTAKRTLELQQLKPLIACTNTHFINLQYGDSATEIAAFAAETGMVIHHWHEAIDDYDDTAALVSALDLVISVCTAVVHLTGALGKPVWVMAPFVAEWRYGWQGSEMIWYTSARIFRQPKSDAWPPVIAEVKRAVIGLADRYQ